MANVLAGRPDYRVTGGEVLYEGEDLLALEPEIRARMARVPGLPISVELPGVRAWQFLKAGIDARRQHHGEEEMSRPRLRPAPQEKVKQVEIDPDLVKRAVNEGFSGGEKKRNEILQMAVLEPRLALLDETDSGLDIDALRIVSEGVNKLRSPENAVILVTHYQRILNYIQPDQYTSCSTAVSSVPVAPNSLKSWKRRATIGSETRSAPARNGPFAAML